MIVIQHPPSGIVNEVFVQIAIEFLLFRKCHITEYPFHGFHQFVALFVGFVVSLNNDVLQIFPIIESPYDTSCFIHNHDSFLKGVAHICEILP